MSTPRPATPSLAFRTVAGLLPLVTAGMIGVVAFLVAGPTDAIRAIQEAGPAFSLVALSALVAAVVAGLLAALAAGARVPLAIPLAVGTWPWVAGIAAASWGASRVAEAVAFADPAHRAMLTAQGLAEALLGRVIGGVVGSGLLAGIALSLAVASLAPRATGRSAIGAVAGLVAGSLPVLVGVAYLVLDGGLGGGALLSGVAVLGAIACAIAGYGAAADAPHARAASLAAATPAAVLLALACAGGAASQLPIVDAAAAIGAAAPAARVEILAAVGDEIAIPVALASYAWGMALLAAAALTGWVTARAKPTAGRLVGAAAVVVVVVLTLLLGQLSERAIHAMLEIEQELPWSAVPEFTPVIADGWDPETPRLVVAVDRIATPGGESAPIAGIETPGPARDRVAQLVRAAMSEPAAAPPSPVAPDLAIAVDARVGGGALRALLAIAGESGAGSVSIVGASTPLEPELIARVPPDLRGIAGTVELRAARALLVGTVADEAASDPRLLHARIVPAHETTAVTLEPRPGGEGATIPASDGPTRWTDGPQPGATRVYLTIDPATPASTLTAVIGRAHALGYEVVLLADDAIPGHPSQPALGAVEEHGFPGGLGSGSGGLGSGSGGLGASRRR